MTYRQIEALVLLSVRNAFSFSCCFVILGLLFGCSTPQPSTKTSQAEQAIEQVAPEITAPPTVDVPLSIAEPTPIVADKVELQILAEENNIFFSSRSTTVDDRGKEKLRQHAVRLKQNPKGLLTLVGYTDDIGSRNFNLAITEERLTAVSALLQTYGAPRRQIRLSRFGRMKGRRTCTSDACRQQMRRVELLISP
jgi:outer membrane protein OmpA-like peptidoglycan-associated protein